MSSGYIEPGLSDQARHIHQALASLQEELEAIDFYHQRADVAGDAELKAVLIHNRDDEMEHAAMVLEWLRKAMPEFDLQLRKFLFHPADGGAVNGHGLGLGNLREEQP